VFVEYAKAAADDILIRITAVNMGPDDAVLHILPTLWFRNTWDWNSGDQKPSLRLEQSDGKFSVIDAEHSSLGKMRLAAAGDAGVLFTENETNRQRLFGVGILHPMSRMHRLFCGPRRSRAVNPQMTGTKAAFHYRQDLASGASCVIRLRLSSRPMEPESLEDAFDATFALRKREADEFYAALHRRGWSRTLVPRSDRRLPGCFGTNSSTIMS